MRNADDRDPKPALTCSLCGKSQHDVSDLAGGPAAFVREFICDECVRLELAKLENPMPALSQSLDQSLRRAVALTARPSDEGVTPEYLLLALTDDSPGYASMRCRLRKIALPRRRYADFCNKICHNRTRRAVRTADASRMLGDGTVLICVNAEPEVVEHDQATRLPDACR